MFGKTNNAGVYLQPQYERRVVLKLTQGLIQRQKLFKNKFASLEISITFANQFRKEFESESKFDLLK